MFATYIFKEIKNNMEKKLTRNKTAEILGVTRQTISNYIRDGLLGGFKDEKGNTYVNAEDVEKYKEKYKFIAVSEEMLDKKLAEIKAAKEQANNELAEARKAILCKNYGACAEDVRNMVTTLYKACLAPHLKAREYTLLITFLEDENASLQDLSEEFFLTPERCRQIIRKACDKFRKNVELVSEDLQSNYDLKAQIEALKEGIKALKAEYDAYRVEHGSKQITDVVLPPKVLSRRFIDCRLSVRCLNCLRYLDLDTIGDLLTNYTSLNDIPKTRNMGNKTKSELSDLIYDLDLVFKKQDESLEEYYVRLNKHLSEKEN